MNWEMKLIGAFQCLVLITIIILVLNRFSKPENPSYVIIPVFISWFFSGCTFILLPIDIFEVTQDQPHSAHSQDIIDNAFIVFWNLYYWINLIMNAFILPVIEYYETSGEFTIKDKIIDALKKQLFINFIVVIIGAILACILLLMGTIEFTQLDKLTIACVNIYGTLLIIFSMGYGIVGFPRNVWFSRDISMELNKTYFEILKSEQRKSDKFFALEDSLKLAHIIKGKAQSSLNSLVLARIEWVLDKVPNDIRGQINYSKFLEEVKDHKLLKQDLSMKQVVELNNLIKESLEQFLLSSHLMKQNFLRALYLESIIRAIDSRHPIIESEFQVFFNRWFLFQWFPKLEVYWYRYLHKLSSHLVFITCTILSIIIVIAELTIFQQKQFVASSLLNLFAQINAALPLIFIFVFVFLSYMGVLCYYAFFSLNIFGLYGFWYKRTESSTLLSTALYMSKMSPPLCFNFMLMIFGNDKKIRETQFYKSIGDINAVQVLSFDIPKYLPIIMLIVIILTLFRCMTRLLNCFGMKQFHVDDNSQEEDIQNGVKLLKDQKESFLDELNEYRRNSKEFSRMDSISTIKEPLHFRSSQEKEFKDSFKQ